MDDDRRLFDEIYQLWSKTTLAEKAYWMPKESEVFDHQFNLVAVSQDGEIEKRVAGLLSDEDAEFIAGLHSALPDLVRLLHSSLDEAERADDRRDELENWVMDLSLEISALWEQIVELERRLGDG